MSEVLANRSLAHVCGSIFVHVVWQSAVVCALTAASAQSPISQRSSTDCAETLSGDAGTAAAQICLGQEQSRHAETAQEAAARRTHLETAVEHYRKAADLASDPEAKAAALDALAELHAPQHLNDLVLMEFALRELVVLLPDQLAPLYRLAKLQEDQGLWDAAESTLVSARRREPEDVEATTKLFQFYTRLESELKRQKAARTFTTQPDKDGVYRAGPELPPPRRIDTLPVSYAKELSAGIKGVVSVEVVVNEAGLVSDAQIVRHSQTPSIPLLEQAALTYVRQWRFEPTIVNGQPVRIRRTYPIDFR